MSGPVPFYFPSGSKFYLAHRRQNRCISCEEHIAPVYIAFLYNEDIYPIPIYPFIHFVGLSELEWAPISMAKL